MVDSPTIPAMPPEISMAMTVIFLASMPEARAAWGLAPDARRS